VQKNVSIQEPDPIPEPNPEPSSYVTPTFIINNTNGGVIHGATPGEWRNFFGIIWNGNVCDALTYAKSMGYKYIGYIDGMEKC
jgi:hypothetical protein